MHVTGYLGDEPRDRVLRFIEVAVTLGYFDEVAPVRRPDGTIIAVAMYSRTLGPVRAQDTMPDICRRLGGILGRGTGIACAWDLAEIPGSRAAWIIPGRGTGTVPGQVIADAGELAPAPGTALLQIEAPPRAEGS